MSLSEDQKSKLRREVEEKAAKVNDGDVKAAADHFEPKAASLTLSSLGTVRRLSPPA